VNFNKNIIITFILKLNLVSIMKRQNYSILNKIVIKLKIKNCVPSFRSTRFPIKIKMLVQQQIYSNYICREYILTS